MALPFMLNKIKKDSGLMTNDRQPDGGMQPEVEEGDEGLKAAAADLISAIAAKDESGVAQALRNAFQILESEPHEEEGGGQEAPAPMPGEEG